MAEQTSWSYTMEVGDCGGHNYGTNKHCELHSEGLVLGKVSGAISAA